MAYQQPYVCGSFTPTGEQGIPNNENVPKDQQVMFDLEPAEGTDLARIKSMIVATIGLAVDGHWGPQEQAAVIAAFETGAPAFVSTVTAVRNYTVPAAMARRKGIITELPTHVPAGSSTPQPNPDAPIPITTGLAYARVCGFNIVLAMNVAKKITELSNEGGADIRFFGQPSGPGGPVISSPTPSIASNAIPPPAGNGTAGRQKARRASRRGGTSRGRQ